MEKNSLARRAKQLNLSALSLARDMRSGPFQSFFKGDGIEFDSAQAYHRGDDVRHIDWNILARSGRVFVKTYKELRSATIMLLADISDSTYDPVPDGCIKDKIIDAAALCACAALHTQSSVGCLTFDAAVRTMLKPHNRQNYLADIFSVLSSSDKKNCRSAGTALPAALQAAGKILTARSLVFVFSDFRVSHYERELTALAEKHDVIAVRFEGTYEAFLPNGGTMPFEDRESGVNILMRTKAVQKLRFESAHEQYNYWKAICSRCGVQPLFVPANDPPLKILQHFFSSVKKSNYVSLSEKNRRWL